jgi:hypothetical protein
LERKLKQIKKRMREKDWLWLNACVGVVEGEAQAVEAYIASGGDPYRQLSRLFPVKFYLYMYHILHTLNSLANFHMYNFYMSILPLHKFFVD